MQPFDFYGGNKMKKASLLVVIFVITSMLSSCGDVPEKVQNDISLDNSINNGYYSDNVKSDKNLIEVEEAVNITPKTADIQKNNVTFKGNIYVPNTSKVYKLSVAPNDSWFKNSKDILKKFAGETDQVDTEIKYFDTFNENPHYYEYSVYTNKDGYDFKASNCGRLSIHRIGDLMKEEGDWAVYHNTFAPPHRIYDDLDNLPNDSYNFYDGKLSVKNGYEKFKNELDKYLPFLPENETIDLKYISAYRYPDKDYYQFYMEGTINYKGVPFNHIDVFAQNSKENNNYSVLYSGFQSNIMSSQKEPFISEIQYNYEVLSEIEEYNKILSFEKAWNILCEKIAKNRKTNISSAELVYLIYFKDKNSYGDEWYNNLKEAPEFFAKPVWCFAERGENAQSNFVFYIDAVTGELNSYGPYVVID